MSRSHEKRFSIDDAFEEESEEAVGPPSSRQHHPHASRTYKCPDDTTSKDSDSLIHDYMPTSQATNAYCWKHPKVKENWKTVLAAVVLLLVGTGLLVMGVFAAAEPDNGVQGAVFLIAGLICFVPGAYHVVYVWLAARGQRGYDFYHLPLFT